MNVKLQTENSVQLDARHRENSVQLDARHRENSVQLDARHRKIVLDILEEFTPQDEAWIFGSRAKGTAKKYSDLDLVLVGQTQLDLQKRTQLSNAFEDSNLPFFVDIVDWHCTSESFRRIIEQSKVILKVPGLRCGSSEL
jgi:uncharacterized protein